MEDKKELQNKVILMYEAVISLIEEGKDINSIKVVDITSRAGIGKGTAYEYFKSKEEIIANALFYDLKKKCQEAIEAFSGESNFKTLIYNMLDWVYQNINNKRTVYYMFKVISNSYDINENIKMHFASCTCDIAKNFDFVKHIAKVGIHDGTIPAGMDEYYYCVAIVSAFAGFIMFMHSCIKIEKVSVECAKDFAYNSIVKSLN